MIHIVPYAIAGFSRRQPALKIALLGCIALNNVYYTLDDCPATEKPSHNGCQDKEMA